MSEIKEKIAEILKEEITYSPQLRGYIVHGAIDKILSLIEANYIPREEHERAEEDAFVTIIKLKEENERLKQAKADLMGMFQSLKSSVKDLLRKQRENESKED